MSSDLNYVALSRRSFLMASSGVAIGVSLGLTGRAEAAPPPPTYQPSAWVTIDSDGTITLMSPSAEMGQGSMTGVPRCLAEELDADWAKVRVLQAPSIPSEFGNPLLFGAMGTHADFSIQGYFEKVRLIGAQVRRVLVLTAAGQFQVDPNQLTTEPSVVIHAASGRRLSYGDLARVAVVPKEMPKITLADLKPRERWRLIGRDSLRVDLPGKVNGSAVFGIDVQRPGMLYAAMLYPTVRKARALQVNDKKARTVPGVLDVAMLDTGVGIVGKTIESVLRGKAALEVEWSKQSPVGRYDSDAAVHRYLGIANDPKRRGVDMVKEGDADALLSAPGATVFTRTFTNPHVAHGVIEPPNATALVRPDGAEFWAPTQGPSDLMARAGRALGVTPDKIVVHSTLVGGGFGRTGDDNDPAMDALFLARRWPGQPVKLIRSREDEFLNDPYRPAAAQRIDAVLDAEGHVRAWRHRLVSPSYFARTTPELFTQVMHGHDFISGLAEHPYGWTDQLQQFVDAGPDWDVGAWRGVGCGYANFASETVMDELAERSGTDPVSYRLAALANRPRGRAVLERVAQMSRWQEQRPKGRTLGLAMASMSGTVAAQVVEISLDQDRKVRVHHVWTAANAGTLITPDAVRAQFEGGAIMGLGPALMERVDVKNGTSQASNFHQYPMPRMSQIPESIEIELLRSTEKPGGVGEIGVTMIAPAIATALTRMTGQRFRSLPLKLG